MAALGMDTEGMKPYPQRMIETIQAVKNQLTQVGQFAQVQWVGTDGDKFRQDYQEESTRLNNLFEQAMNNFSGRLRQEITQQEQTSGASGTPSP